MPPAATRIRQIIRYRATATLQTMAKIYKSYILTMPRPHGHVMSVKCEQPLDELTVHVWLLYDHPNFKYCTLFISGTELWTDGRIIQTPDAPLTFQAGGIILMKVYWHMQLNR